MSRKTEHKPFLYHVVSLALRFWMKIFFEKIDVRHSHNIPATGPVVFVANHPDSIMDALLFRAITKRKVNFIGHAGLFSNPVMGWLLRHSGNIPVYNQTGDPDKKTKNVSMFQACTEVLQRGESIMIFPEGVSKVVRKIQKIKTGAARILLESEAQNDFQLGVRLVPLGLHFYSRAYFYTRVLVNFGEPIELDRFFDAYRKDEFSGVRGLTDEIERRLVALTVNVRDEELDPLVRDIERIYRAELKTVKAESRSTQKKAQREKFFISKAIAECMQYLHDNEPERLADLREQISKYNRKLKRLNLHDAMLRDTTSQREIIRQVIKAYSLSIVGFLPACYGVLNNYIPFRFANFFARKQSYERTKILTALFIGGGLAFNFFYVLQTALAVYFFGLLWGIVYSISLPVSGFYALWYITKIRKQKRNTSFSFYLFTNKHLFNRMRRQRKQLINLLDAIREDFLKVHPQWRTSAESE